jgi:LacI family transcriptional regulator
MKVSLKDIANQLQLSKTTVSWVLSGKGDEKGISMATQEKVFVHAKKMNYQPNLLARSLHTGQSSTIGLIIPEISDTFYSEIAQEVEAAAEKYGYSLMISGSGSQWEREERMIRLFRSRQVDGIIIAPTKQSRKEILHMINDSYPFVVVDRYFPELNTNYIIIDNEESSYKLVKHLIKKGHRKIAMLSVNSYLKSLSLREKGYLCALKDNGMEINPALCREVPFHNYKTNIFTILDEMYKQEPDIDAFFFTSHVLILEAFTYFYDNNININDTGLACIHDLSAFRVLAPRINTARMPVEQIGSEAVRILINEINQKQLKMKQLKKESIVLSCSLSYRE